MNVVTRSRSADRWFDSVLAAALFSTCMVEAAIDLHGDRSRHHWPLAVNIVVIIVMTVLLAWRRRAPLVSASIVMTSVVLLVGVGLSDTHNVNSPQLLLFIAPYSVAAHSARPRAVVGLAACVVAIGALNVLTSYGAGSWIFSIGTCIGSWATGRLLRARRALATELQHTTSRIAAEREGRELLAITEQRTRIARELQTLVANSVSTMIVQTQAAQRLLDQDLDEADAAMATIEDTGRQALIEMRRILGVLRRAEDDADLAPQPGVGQIAALVERERLSRRRLALQVEGDPGPLPASVDLGVYRILEDALRSVDDHTGAIDILLRFAADDVELTVTSSAFAGTGWPSSAMRERVALCQGVVSVIPSSESGQRLIVRLPRVFEGALI